MSNSDKAWNNNRNVDMRRPNNFSGRPTFGGTNENIHLQIPRNPQMGPPPHQQFQNYSNMSEQPFTPYRNNIPRHPQFQNPPTRLPSPQLQQPNPSFYQGFSAPPPNHIVLPPNKVALSPNQVPHPPSHITPPRNHIAPSPNHVAPPPNHIVPPPNHIVPPPNHVAPPPNHVAPPPNHSIPPPNNSVNSIGQSLFSGDSRSAAPYLNMNFRPPPLPQYGSFQQRPIHPPFPYNPSRHFSADHLQHSEASYKSLAKHAGMNEPGIGNGRQDLDDKELGTQKLEKWLQKVGKSKRPHLKGTLKIKPSEQIWKSVNDLRGLAQLISAMSGQLKEMADCASSASISTWETMTSSLEKLKGKCISLTPSLDEPSVQNIKRKLLKVHQKRARLRQARVFKFEEEQKLRESWLEKSQQIDKWQERHRSKIKEEIMRKSRKAAADYTLSKVSREIQDATHLIETMLALQKLRLIRRDAAQKRGDTDLGESRQTFEQKIADMTRLVESQLECYKEEEAKLKQVIKSEQEEDTEKERLLQIEREKQKQREEDEEIRTILFGPQEEITESHPRFPYVQFYRQAEISLQSFVQIRREWDSFLAPQNTATSSVIPSSWVLPEPPSSSTWASALK